jgi:hypothetical protein
VNVKWRLLPLCHCQSAALVKLTRLPLVSLQFSAIVISLFPALSNATKHCHPTTATRSITATLPLPLCHCQSLHLSNSLNSQPNHFIFPPLLYHFFPLFPTLPPCHCHSFHNRHCHSATATLPLSIFTPVKLTQFTTKSLQFSAIYMLLFPALSNAATLPLPLVE